MTAAERLAALSPEARTAALDALDAISHPLDVRTLDKALAGHLTRSERKPVIRALLGAFDIIVVAPKA